MIFPFVLLALSICAVWAPNPPPAGGKSIPPWLVVFVAAVVAGLIAGVLTWPAVLALALLTALAWAAKRQEAAGPRRILIALAVVLALAIALHQLLGFFNPLIADRIRLTPGAAPFTLYANFDKGAAGAVLLAFFAPRARTWKEFGALLSPLLLGAVGTSAVVFATALAIGYVRVEPQLPDFTPIFLALNLFFVCVAEEAMFRGLLQERMTQMLEGRSRHWGLLPIAVSALLFGAAHAAGGPQLILLATLAGLGYSWTYARTRKIEAAILAHFIVNAAQFLCSRIQASNDKHFRIQGRTMKAKQSRKPLVRCLTLIAGGLLTIEAADAQSDATDLLQDQNFPRSHFTRAT